MSADHRQEALARVKELIAVLQSSTDPRAAAILTECEALSKAIAAFHMEGIRFRIYNVDRLLRAATATPAAGSVPAASAALLPAAAAALLPAAAAALLEDARKHLEAAGFHTRSHQAPI